YSCRCQSKQLSYKEKSSIHFVGEDDPPFIKKLKLQVGYKAPATVEDKVSYLRFQVKEKVGCSIALNGQKSKKWLQYGLAFGRWPHFLHQEGFRNPNIT
uniref:Uncharacterized protein n=1 Tax=Parascaris equorum TaxID=6256 RepID=A0A914RGX5_PAREQ